MRLAEELKGRGHVVSIFSFSHRNTTELNRINCEKIRIRSIVEFRDSLKEEFEINNVSNLDVFADRFIYNGRIPKDSRIKAIHKMSSLIEDTTNSLRTVVVGEIASLFEVIFYNRCKDSKRAQFLYPIHSKRTGYFTFQDREGQIIGFHKDFRYRQYSDVIIRYCTDYIDEVRNRNLKPDFFLLDTKSTQTRFLVKKTLLRVKNVYLKLKTFRIDNAFGVDYPSQLDVASKDFVGSIVKNLITKVVRRNWHKTVPEGKFVFLPLHFQPEYTTNVLSPIFCNQEMIIEYLSKIIPYNYSLVVKEHPGMFGARSVGFYGRLAKIHNVKFIDVNYDSHTLIRKCQFVATNTGTAGLEAVILGKPVLTFGNIFYNHLTESVLALEDRKLVSDVEIEKWLKEFNPIEDDKLIKFLAECHVNSFAGNLLDPNKNAERLHSSNIKRVVNAFEKVVRNEY